MFDTLLRDEDDKIATLPNEVVSVPVLALSLSEGHLSPIWMPAKIEIGCFLMQEHPDKTWKPLSYWSRTLNEAKETNDKTHRECLALVWSASYLANIWTVINATFVRVTMLWNRSLIWRKSLAIWLVGESINAKIKFDVLHRAETKNQTPDKLWQIKTNGTDSTKLFVDIPEMLVSLI